MSWNIGGQMALKYLGLVQDFKDKLVLPHP